MSETLEQEVERLRSEVASYRQRELAELRSALAAALEENRLLRAEAERNASVGREIARVGQAEIASLRAQLQAATRLDAYQHRFGKATNAADN